MEAVLAGLIAIGGTLLGSLVTFLFQQRAAQRTELFTISARLREERMTVYSGFAGAILEYRSAQYERALQAFQTKDSVAYADARTRSHELRAAARHALYRVHLLADDPQITRLADQAMALVADLNEAEDKSALAQRNVAVREAVEKFIAAASTEVTKAKPPSRQ
ncbi:hypothetical protein ACIBHX_51925 [Nonomuraea sp. NPDC050536]|uniref:hypothetical protein n=1 Tax=Nonomuraea sp. NPDC050536 TaxID=3364366 RepID=UPI0037CBABBD